MKKKKLEEENEDFIIIMSDEPEHIKEKNYYDLKKYIIKILNNIDKYKDNKVPV